MTTHIQTFQVELKDTNTIDNQLNTMIAAYVDQHVSILDRRVAAVEHLHGGTRTTINRLRDQITNLVCEWAYENGIHVGEEVFKRFAPIVSTTKPNNIIEGMIDEMGDLIELEVNHPDCTVVVTQGDPQTWLVSVSVHGKHVDTKTVNSVKQPNFPQTLDTVYGVIDLPDDFTFRIVWA